MIFTLETARLRLRPFQASDLPAYHAQVGSDPEVMRYLPGGVAMTESEFKRWVDHFMAHWEERHYGFMVVEEKSTGQLIGDCGLQWLSDLNEVEVGYAFGKAHWGKGYASEAARACLHWGFEDLKLPLIVAVTNLANQASQHVLTKIGLKRHGEIFAYGSQVTYFRLTAEEFANTPYPVSN